MFTSQYVHEHGVWWNGIDLAHSSPVLPRILRDAGYDTGIVGKLHVSPARNDHGFTHREQHEECLLDGTGLNAYEKFLSEQGAVSPDVATRWSDERTGVGICTMPEEQEETRWVADKACGFLRSRCRPRDLHEALVADPPLVAGQDRPAVQAVGKAAVINVIELVVHAIGRVGRQKFGIPLDAVVAVELAHPAKNLLICIGRSPGKKTGKIPTPGIVGQVLEDHIHEDKVVDARLRVRRLGGRCEEVPVFLKSTPSPTNKC